VTRKCRAHITWTRPPQEGPTPPIGALDGPVGRVAYRGDPCTFVGAPPDDVEPNGKVGLVGGGTLGERLAAAIGMGRFSRPT
jgi:hypothetical protein